MMLRDVPPLQVLILRQLAATPMKCLHEDGCLKTLRAVERGDFAGQDLIQRVVQHIIDAGRMTDDAVPPILFRNRSAISLSNSKISGRYLVKVASLCAKKLISLDVSGCFQISAEVMREVFSECPNIVHLNVRSCRKLTGSFMELIAQNRAPKLATLNVGGNYNIDDEGVRRLVTGFAHINKLQQLDLSGLSLSDATILLVAEKCTELTSIGLGYLDLRESTYATLFTNLGAQLETIDISWPSTVVPSSNNQISADFLLHSLSALCTRVTELDVSGNRNVTTDVLRELIERKLAQQQDGSMMESRMLEVLSAKFVGSAKPSIEANIKAVYPGIRIVC